MIPPFSSPANDWLLTKAWPLWLEHGVDWRRGAFHEWLQPDLRCTADYRRLRVAARQVYVFAQASRAGVPRARDAVQLGVDFLRRHARQEDGGFAWRFHLDNTPSDQTRDFYDHAFVLLAFAHAAAVLPDDAALPGEAAALLAYLDANFAHPACGYREALPDRMPRRQNPHMHLLEALLAAHTAFGDGLYLVRAAALVALLLDRLLQRQEGALPEFFDATFKPDREPDGRFLVEPGHHYEWVWLLGRYLAATGGGGRAAEIETAMALLMAHAERWGLDRQTGLAADLIYSDGAVCTRTFRLWPQAERLKAALLRPALSAVSPAGCLALLQRYMAGAPPGLWQEWLAADGATGDGISPASSLYHLTGALLEPAA